MASTTGPKRALALMLVASAACGLLYGLHYYIARRLIFDPALPGPWRAWGIAALVVLGLSLVIQPLAERLVQRRVARFVAWPASLWMGFAFYLLVLLAGTDLLWWILGSAASAASSVASAAAPPAAPRAIAVTAIAVAAFSTRTGLRPPELLRIEIPLARWPARLDGLKIVQLSDIHIGPILERSFARDLVERVNALEPDLIVITGDLVDGSARQLRDEVAPFGDLNGRLGVYFVTGNHDHYSGVHSWCDVVASLGIRTLRNERVEIRDRECVFDLVGVDDHRGSHFGDDGGEDLVAAFDGRDPERPALLLAHDPSTFKRASELPVDLQISGHTHGGQMWPFGYLVRLAIPFVAGRYRRGDSELYVSSGTGFWGPPMRLLAPAELTEITLRGGCAAEAA